MSTKFNSPPYILLKQAAVVATITTNSSLIPQRDNLGYVISWTNGSGAPTGQFFVQVQDDSTDPWSNLDFGASILLANNSGSNTVNVNQCPYQSIRIMYVPAAGQVDLQITVVTKKIGG